MHHDQGKLHRFTSPKIMPTILLFYLYLILHFVAKSFGTAWHESISGKRGLKVLLLKSLLCIIHRISFIGLGPSMSAKQHREHASKKIWNLRTVPHCRVWRCRVCFRTVGISLCTSLRHCLIWRSANIIIGDIKLYSPDSRTDNFLL